MGAACCCCGQQNRNNAQRPQKPIEQVPLIPNPNPNPNPDPEHDIRAVDLLQTQKIQDDEERKKREAERLRKEEQDRLQREEEQKNRNRLAAEEEERKRKEKEQLDRLQAEINRQQDLFKSQLEKDINRDLNFNQSDIQVTRTTEMSYEFDENELLGPILIERMNFTVDSNENFNEIQGNVEILQYLQPGTNSTNSFIIQYQNKKYFMKTFYGMKKTSCSDIIQGIGNFQHKNKQRSENSQPLANALKYLCYYHREGIDQDHITMSFISTVEQYNLYTFAADESIPLDIKIQVAVEIVQTGRWIICNDTLVKLDFDLKYLKPSNILISVQNNQAKVSFSDWYYQLKFFNKVINQEDSFDPRYSSNIVSNYEESGQVLQANQQQGKKEMDPQQTASFKLLLVLIFYNLDLSSDDPMGILNGYNDLNLRIDNTKDLDKLLKSVQLNDYIEKTIAQKQKQDQNKYNQIWETLQTKGIESFYGLYRK